MERKLSSKGRGQGGLEAKLRVQTIQTPHLDIEARVRASAATRAQQEETWGYDGELQFECGLLFVIDLD